MAAKLRKGPPLDDPADLERPAAGWQCGGVTDPSPSRPSFPRQHARTRRFTLGAPRDFTIAPAGDRVLFLRSRGGSDPVTCLWRVDVGEPGERLLADPAALLGDAAGEEVPPEEAARRERAREQAAGIVRYSTDRSARLAVFGLSGRVWLADVEACEVRELEASGAATEVRLDPTGSRVAYVSAGELRTVAVDGSGDRCLAAPEAGEVTYGMAEFVAAEEMGRSEGYWWSPDGSAVLVARVDTGPVMRWYLADPAVPARAPRAVAYPAAGTANAEVSLWLMGLDGSRVPVEWDRGAFEYLVAAHWGERGLLVVVQSRDQRRARVLEIDPATGAGRVRREDTDPDWVDIVAGVPRLTGSGDLVWTADDGGTRHLLVGDEAVTPSGLQVRSVLDVDGDTVLLRASEEPTEVHLWKWSSGNGLVRLTAEPGVHTGRTAGGTTVLVSRTLDRDGPVATIERPGEDPVTVESLAESPVIEARPLLCSLGHRQLRTALLWPRDHRAGSSLPVLLDPYGGPGAQRVVAARNAYLTSQWFADQGFAVLVADGRGTPGRGPEWDRSIRGDFATPVLDDQVEALHAAAAGNPDLDLSRVAIRGWSFGGYLAALAVLRRPDVFAAAVSGAPVVEHRLYDTHYMERYLGHPDQEPANYDRCSLLGDAPRLERPLLLIHGLADDNVSVAHTLQLSSALLAAGRPHAVLPLSGVTHMTPQEVVAENLLLLQLDFLRRALGC